MILRRVTLALLILYALINAYSVVGKPLVMVAPLVGLLFAFLHAGQREGWRRALLLLALTFGVSLLFESVGVATGIVYGPYHYTDRLGVKFLGLVPLIIPVAWFMMSYPSYVIADRLVDSGGDAGMRGASRPGAAALRLLAVAAVGGLVMTAWDVIMDPMMVAGGHWVWEVQGPYFGIPLQNFWGWWLTIFTTFALYLLLRGKRPVATAAGFDWQAVTAYLVTALAAIASSAARGSGDLALIGFFVMLPWALMAFARLASGRRVAAQGGAAAPLG